MYVCVLVNISYVYIIYGMYVCVCVNIVSFCVCFVFTLVQKNGIVRAPEVKPLINQSFACCLAVILPTLWDYLRLNFGATKWFYGLTLSAFSMAKFISGPLYGLAFDYIRHTKLIILFSNLFLIGGQNSVVTYS